MLTASVMAPSGQAIASAHARLRTKAPSGAMSPHSSATGMNSAGETNPSSGCGQRTSASAPVISPVCEVDERLIMHLEVALGERRAQVRLHAPARLHACVHLGLEIAEVPATVPFA